MVERSFRLCRSGGAQGMACVRGVMAFMFAAAVSLAMMMSNKAAQAMDIQVVKSDSGVEAWLVEDHSVPLIALRFAFQGGSAQDPNGKEGLANFLTTMLDEGAGDYNAETFQRLVEESAAKISFSSGRDSFFVSFQTLTANREQAVPLLKLALSKPRFDNDAVERMRGQLLARLAFDAKSPNRVAGLKWSEQAFPNHPYGRPSNGTMESVRSITASDLEGYRKRVFARDNVKIAVVGDIDAASLKKLLDEVFGDLPAKSELTPVPQAKLATGQQIIVKMPVPQSVAVFGLPGIARDDKDFIAAYVMNQILGGGGFASRLMEEVREKRGLAYSVYSYLQALDYGPVFAGAVATKNERVAESLNVIKAEFERMAKDGPTETELANAKSYLIGSYALRFDTSSKIARQLLGIQMENLGLNYIEKRNDLIQAVTIEDVRRVAKRLLDTKKLIVTVVGQPVGLDG